MNPIRFESLILSLTTAFIALGFGLSVARAEIFPESTHEMYRTYGLLYDDQTSLLWRSAGRALASIFGTVALWQPDGENPFRPQLVLRVGVRSAYHADSTGLNNESVDSETGLAWNTRISKDWLFSIGLNHTSGHAGDDLSASDQYLIPYNVGIDEVPIRILYKGDNRFRFGATARPILGAEPNIQHSNTNEFLEFFPWGHFPGKKATPYIAGSLEQWGHTKTELSGNIQIGAYIGNHIEPRHQVSGRWVLGYYSGNDTRLKMYLFQASRVQFLYTGLMIDL